MKLHDLLPPNPTQTFSKVVKTEAGDDLEGSAEFFAFDLRHAEGSSEWLNSVKELAKDKKALTKLPGEWVVSARQGEITVNYTPFSFKVLTDRYARYLDTTQMDDERYKWECVQIFQAGWKRLEEGEIDFATFFKGLRFDNLVHYFSTSAWNTLVEHDAERFKYELNALYNEDVPLEKRIKNFSEEVTRVYIEATNDVSKNTGQNERAIGVLLAFRYPDRYALYKDDFYKTLAKCLGHKPLPKWKKYVHYMALVNDFKTQHMGQCEDIIAITNRLTADEKYYPDQEHMLLIQNIFYRVLSATMDLAPSAEVNELATIQMNVKHTPSNETHPSSAVPTNQILFGPPGTGKTYLLSSKYFPKYTASQSNISKEVYLTELVAQLTWWQVIAIALKDLGPSRVNTLLEHPWVEMKSRQSNSKNVRATLWGALQMHTPPESTTVAYKQRQMPYLFDKGDASRWKLLEEEYLNNAAELEQIRLDAQNFAPKPDKVVKRYVFTTFHQSFTYEDFIEGLKPDLDDEAGDLRYIIEDGVFKALCKRADADPEHRYAIFIDEINRGNIAAIFGELITLIEPDKRKGCENALSVTLPYSKTAFSVPPNLDIYGTMNTADRSVEALDTALRRRFSFLEMPPQPALIASAGQAKESKGSVNGIHLPTLLERVNNRIEQLLDKDHLIGHAYFMTVDDLKTLKQTFRDKIIPLLQEYFFGDFGKIGLVLGSGFVNVKASANSNIFADFPGYESGDLSDRMVYNIASIDAMTDEDFIAALVKGKLVDSHVNEDIAAT